LPCRPAVVCLGNFLCDSDGDPVWSLYGLRDSFEIDLGVLAVAPFDLLDGPEYFLIVLHVFTGSLPGAVVAPAYWHLSSKTFLRVSYVYSIEICPQFVSKLSTKKIITLSR
jgi:hypothetical protein